MSTRKEVKVLEVPKNEKLPDRDTKQSFSVENGRNNEATCRVQVSWLRVLAVATRAALRAVSGIWEGRLELQLSPGSCVLGKERQTMGERCLSCMYSAARLAILNSAVPERQMKKMKGAE